MKAVGETLSFIKIEGEPKKQDTTGIETFRQKDCCRTELWRDLYKKTPKGQFLEIRNHLAEAFKIIPNYLGRIFQVKGQSKNCYITIFTLFFLFI